VKKCSAIAMSWTTWSKLRGRAARIQSRLTPAVACASPTEHDEVASAKRQGEPLLDIREKHGVVDRAVDDRQ
jgi:hypothetical protein